MKKLKEKGITLVALVITIIILLIIVGISLANIVGSNGLFERTKLATEKYKGSENEESDQLAHVSNEIEQHHEALLPKPTINISISGDKEQGVSPKVQVSIKQTYSAGINVAKSKWTVNNSSSKLGIDESLYNNTFNADSETIEVPLSEGQNYIHILTTTNDNVRTETISSVINAIGKIHNHEGVSTTAGGCYNTPVYHTHVASCGRTELTGRWRWNKSRTLRCKWSSLYNYAM